MRGLVTLIVAAYIALAIGFSLGPIFEGPDEIEHYRYAQTLADNAALPDPYSRIRSEFHQPPLYYAVLAPVLALVDDDDFARLDEGLNPFFPGKIDIVSSDNKNKHLHNRDEAFPFTASGTAMAVHLMRLLTVAMGGGTVITSYGIFRLLWPDRPDRRIAALGFVAFMPQFVYMSGNINNDNLLHLLATLTLYLLLLQWRDGWSLQRSALLGVVLGAALLTKSSAVFLAIPVGAAILLQRRAWRFVPLILVVVLSIAGWYYARNFALYGSVTNTDAWVQTWTSDVVDEGRFVLSVGLSRAPLAYWDFWARFGGGGIPISDTLDDFLDAVTLIVVVGAVLGLGVRLVGALREAPLRINASAVIVAAFGMAWLVALVYLAGIAWNGTDGRYLLSGIATWGALFAFGTDTWTPRRLKLPTALLTSVMMAVVVGLCLFVYYLPSYAIRPAPAAIEHPLSYRFTDENGTEIAELIGAPADRVRVYAGDTLTFSLYWRALAETAVPYQIYLHSITLDGEPAEIVRRDSLPATGNLLATDWQAGQTWTETYIVDIPNDAPDQTLYTLVAGLYDPINETALPSQTLPVVAQLAVNGDPQNPAAAYHYGDLFGLSEPEITLDGQWLEVCLRWWSLQVTDTDYQVLLHVVDGADGGELVTQGDRQPHFGRYPTSAWRPTEAVDDCMTLDLPSPPEQDWHVGIGLYNLTDGARLTLQDSQGESYPENVIWLPLTIER